MLDAVSGRNLAKTSAGVALSIAPLHAGLQFGFSRIQCPTAVRIPAVGWNGGVDGVIERREIHIMRAGVVEPPIAVLARSADATIRIERGEDGIRAGAVNCGWF